VKNKDNFPISYLRQSKEAVNAQQGEIISLVVTGRVKNLSFISCKFMEKSV